MQYRTLGIVIRGTDYGEGNKIITLLTEQYGKQGIVVRGARKPKSRFGAAAQPFTYGDYSFFKTSGLGTLNYAEVVDPFRKLREDLAGAAYAAYAAELTDRALQDEDAGPWVFHQLYACFTAFAEGKDPFVVIRAYEMKIAAAAGYAPVLHACASCGREEGLDRFGPLAGGLLCRVCAAREPHAAEIDEGMLKLLRLVSGIDMRRLGNVSLKAESKLKLGLLVRNWLDAHLPLKLKSRPFLDQLEKGDDFFKLSP